MECANRCVSNDNHRCYFGIKKNAPIKYIAVAGPVLEILVLGASVSRQAKINLRISATYENISRRRTLLTTHTPS